ncbi:MAG: UDP-3-O-(3-hydroxymyristoyl)glucosamine N-acyltransferase [Parachlamydiaceae bacterium]
MSKKSYTLQELADLTQSTLVGDPHYCITNVESLELATPTDASFLSNPRYEKAMLKSEAGVIFVSALPSVEKTQGRQFLVNGDPSRAFQQTAEAFYGTGAELTGFEDIHPTAVIHATATIGKGCAIGPYAVIDKNVVIGEGTMIGAGSYVGPCVKIGDQCLLHPRVTIRENCLIGNRVILQPGAVIGSCGFGYLTDKTGRHTKLNQLGTVILGDDVEIGANTTIDRARFKETEIKRGTKIDNLVQIGHGAVIGEDNMIVAQVGIAGSSKTGRHVTIGGQAALAGHLTVAPQVMIAGRAGVTKSITHSGIYGGFPARPIHEYNRTSVYLQNIDTHVAKIKALEARLNKLEQM